LIIFSISMLQCSKACYYILLYNTYIYRNYILKSIAHYNKSYIKRFLLISP